MALTDGQKISIYLISKELKPSDLSAILGCSKQLVSHYLGSKRLSDTIKARIKNDTGGALDVDAPEWEKVARLLLRLKPCPIHFKRVAFQ